MSKYLKKFENHAAYEAAKSGLILPNVSLCVNENEVHYNPSSPTPPTPSHDYVEIGGIKWATMNVGANSITDTGLYFQWGDTQGYTAAQVGSGSGQKYFSQEDCKYFDSENYSYTKYNDEDGLTTLQASDDAVTAAWGGNWRTPTTAEFAELGESVDAVWVEVNGISGIMCTDKTDETKTLFFPAVGNAYYGNIPDVGANGYYWSSELYGAECCPWGFKFDEWNTHWERDDGFYRYQGFAIRGILDE